MWVQDRHEIRGASVCVWVYVPAAVCVSLQACVSETI